MVASVAPLVIFSSRFGRTVILSRSLSPSDYGVVVALMTIYTILDVIVFLIVSGGYAASVAMLLDVLVPLVYGLHYAASPGITVLVALLSFARFCRQGPTAILLIAGRTRQLAAANLIAGIGLVIGYALGVLCHNLPAVLPLGDIVYLLSGTAAIADKGHDRACDVLDVAGWGCLCFFFGA